MGSGEDVEGLYQTKTCHLYVSRGVGRLNRQLHRAASRE